MIDGIPFWCDKDKNLYYYDVNPAAPKTILLGSKAADGTAKLHDNWEHKLSDTPQSVPSRSQSPQSKASSQSLNLRMKFSDLSQRNILCEWMVLLLLISNPSFRYSARLNRDRAFIIKNENSRLYYFL